MPYFIGGEITDSRILTLQTPHSFKTRFNIEVRVKNEVIAIDPENKNVTVRNIEEDSTYIESYDKLILSPGAEPIVPEIEGAGSNKVFTLRNIPDTMKIKRYIEEKSPKNCVVVGGGYIGVEMAENLSKTGLNVTIVELSDHLIAALDFDMSVDVHKYLNENGIKLY